MTFRRGLWVAVVLVLLGTALYFRSAGLFRGLKSGHIFNPDAPKQVAALEQFLNDREIWYTDNVFYDGYPLFLNHVDAWIIRPIRQLCLIVDSHVNPALHARDTAPSRDTLYYWGRALRVIYGLLVIFLAFYCARGMGLPHSGALFVALLVSIHAISITVTRSVSGDIGADLFTALVLIGLCRSAVSPGRILPWLFMGTMLAFAFTSKYHSILAGWSILIFWLGHDVFAQRNFRMALRHAAAGAVGFAAGLAIALPQLFINPRRTQDDIIRHLQFVKDFKVDAAILNKPFIERAYLGLTTNGPKVIGALGWLMVIFGALAAILVVIGIIRQRRMNTTVSNDMVLKLAVYSLPFVVLIAALMGKPSIQMFHFSWLVVPLALAAVDLLHRGWSRGGGIAVCAAAAGILLVAQTGRASLADLRFWRHEDNGTIALSLDRNLTEREPSSVPKQIVRLVRLENENAAGFRNVFNSVRVANGSLWHHMGIAPVPTIPYPDEFHWIFMNGPVFPRNDRLIPLHPNTPLSRELVFNGKPGPLWVGLRTGDLPVEIRLMLGGVSRIERMAANSQTLFPLRPLRYRELAGSTNDPGGALRCFVPLEASTLMGDAWITLMMNETERANFLFFGGTPLPGTQRISPIADINVVNHLVEKAQYLGGDEDLDLFSNKIECVFFDRIPLAAGVYELRYEAIPLDPSAGWILTLSSESCTEPLMTMPVHPDPAHQNRVQPFIHVFSKPYTPLQVTLSLTCPTGACRVGKWSLKPAVRQITADIARYENEGIRADWMHAEPAGYRPATQGACGGIQFGKALELIDFKIPATLTTQSKTPITCAMRILKIPFPYRHYEDYLVFLHFKTPHTDKIKGVVHIPLTPVVASEQTIAPMVISIPDLPAGPYEVWMGLYNIRTRKRLDIVLPGDKQESYPVTGQKIMVSKVDIHE